MGIKDANSTWKDFRKPPRTQREAIPTKKVQVSYATSNSGVKGKADVSVGQAPWEREQK